MGKRTILAIVISILIIICYDTLFVSPQRIKNRELKSQIIEDKQDTLINQTIKPGKENFQPPPALNTVDKSSEILTTLNSPAFSLEFSNLGGNLNTIVIHDSKRPIPLSNILNIENFYESNFSLNYVDLHRISYFFQNETFLIVKKYEITDKNLIKASIEIKNVSNLSKEINFNINIFNINSIRVDNNQNNSSSTYENVLNEYSLYFDKKLFRKGKATNFSQKEEKIFEETPKWIGFRNRYFCFLVKPEFDSKNSLVKFKSPEELSLILKTKEIQIKPGDQYELNFTFYAGPQDFKILKSYNKDFEKIISFSNFGVIDFFGKIIYHIMIFSHNIFRNWGVCIIFISLFVFGITYPLTFKSMMSMKKMQQLQPEMNILKEKHKDNPQKLNAEMLELYKKHKINPIGGCLPFLLQMPIFFALYQVL